MKAKERARACLFCERQIEDDEDDFVPLCVHCGEDRSLGQFNASKRILKLEAAVLAGHEVCAQIAESAEVCFDCTNDDGEYCDHQSAAIATAIRNRGGEEGT